MTTAEEIAHNAMYAAGECSGNPDAHGHSDLCCELRYDIIKAQAELSERTRAMVNGVVKAVSKAIHLEEWCPTRDGCSGTSASSDAHARAALRTVVEFMASDPFANAATKP